MGNKNTIHGMATKGKPHPIYTTWVAIKGRCYNKHNPKYEDYGRRGISVCNEWVNDFISFRKWAIEAGWKEGLSIERLDNSKGYSPENCVWADAVVQNRNKRNNINIIAFGEIKCAAEWAKDSRCTVTDESIKYRINKLGWNAEKAITHLKLLNQYSYRNQL